MDTEEKVSSVTEPSVHVNGDHYLAQAHLEQSKGNVVGAVQNYLFYVWFLQSPNDMKLDEQINLTKLLINLDYKLKNCESSVKNELTKCYLMVLNTFPQNALLLNAFGLYFFAQNEHVVAKTYFQQAASLGFLPGEKNFLHVMWHLIPRWHFRMLNDDTRNFSFQRALQKAVNEGFTKVCDIGTGCGLLSLMAVQADPNVKVTCFEESKILSGIAKKVFKKNSFSNRVKLISKNSNDVTTLPEPCNLIVTEIFDAAVFGENCLKTIEHAVNNFVSGNAFKIIPERVTTLVTGFQCLDLFKSHKYIETLPELGLQNICLLEMKGEPYDSEYLNNHEIRYLTNTDPILEVNFYDKSQLAELISPDKDSIQETEIRCSETGIMHGFAVWFNLYLDKETQISTNPKNADNLCWEQGIFYLDHPIKVTAGEVLKVKPRLIDSQLKFSIVNFEDNCGKCFHVSKEIISFLNDDALVKHVIQAATAYNGNIIVFDFNIFPLFGFLMAVKGSKVYHIYQNEHDLGFFKHIISSNGLSKQKFVFIPASHLEQFMMYLDKPDIVYTNILQTDGSWARTEYSIETQEKLNVEQLPKKIYLKAQLIHSDYLDFCNIVDDTKAFNFGISLEINKFCGNEHPNLDRFNYEEYSTIVTFDLSDLDTIDFHGESNVIKDGTCNAILYWFEMQLTDDVNIKFSTLNSSFFKKICTLLNTHKMIKTGESITFHVMRLEGYLKVSCD